MRSYKTSLRSSEKIIPGQKDGEKEKKNSFELRKSKVDQKFEDKSLH